MSDSDKMRAEFEAWVTKNAHYNLSRVNSPESSFHGQYKSVDTEIAFKLRQAAYAAGQEAEREEVNCKIERLLTEFRHFIEEVEQTGIYYDNARVGTALANAWRVFDDIAAQIRGKPEGER
jgi:hypothetical protein